MSRRSIAAPLVLMMLAVACGAVPETPTRVPSGPTSTSSSDPSPSGDAPTGSASTSTPTPTLAPTPTPTPAPEVVAGTVTWEATTTSRTSADSREIWDVSGLLDLRLEEDLGQFVAMPGMSTYTYDLEHIGCTPATTETGTLETVIQTTPFDDVAQLLTFGPVAAEFEMQIFFDDGWPVTCPPGPSTIESTAPNAFPGCGARQGVVPVTPDGAGGYRIACDIATSIDNGGIVVEGRISGTLLPVAP